MKKKRSTRLTVNLLDILIGIVCLVGTIYCLLLFWKDINQSFTKANEEPIAVIYFKKNTAQRKLLDGNIWERIKTATPIYNGDKIRTASLSEAYTIFNDCSKIDIHENTLVQIFNKENRNSIEFVSGSISVLSTDNLVNTDNRKNKESQNFQINAGNKILNFDSHTSATISISSQNSNQAIITVTSGEVFMEEIVPSAASAGTKLLSTIGLESAYKEPVTANLTTITAGSTIEFEPLSLDQKFKDILSEFAVTMPTSTYSVTLSKTKQTYVPFFWSNSKDIQLDFARDSAFADIILSKTLSSSSGRSSVSIDFAKDEQTLYWRAIPLPLSIETAKQQRQQLPQGVIFIHQPEEMLMLQPIATVFGEENAVEMEKEIQASQEKSDIQLLEIINLKDEKSEPVAETVVAETAEPVVETLVEEKPAVETPVVEKPVAEKPAAKATPAPKANSAPKAAETKPKTSSITNQTPQILGPFDGKIFTEEDFMVDDASIGFTWKSMKDADSYLLEVFDPNNKKIASHTVRSGIYYFGGSELELLSNGTFTWTIQAIQKIDGVEYKSKVNKGTFTIKIEDIESAEVDTENLLQ